MNAYYSTRGTVSACYLYFKITKVGYSAGRSIKKGFTLIELLVVISIIALLLSVLVPSLKKAREQAVLTKCRAYLRQYGLGVTMYAHDNDGKVVPSGIDAYPWPGWWDFLMPYIGEGREKKMALVCPKFKTEDNLDIQKGTEEIYIGYLFNANFYHNERYKLESIYHPEITPFAWDDYQLQRNPYGGYPGGGSWYHFRLTHAQRVNLGTCSGGVVTLGLPRGKEVHYGDVSIRVMWENPQKVIRSQDYPSDTCNWTGSRKIAQ